MQPRTTSRTQSVDTMHPCLVLTANFEISYRKIEYTFESILKGHCLIETMPNATWGDMMQKVMQRCRVSCKSRCLNSHLVNNGCESTPDVFAQEGQKANLRRDQHAEDAETSQDYCLQKRLDQQREGAGMVDLDGNNASHASLIAASFSQVCFITERITGGSLLQYIKRINAPLKQKVIKNWCRQILEGYLHFSSFSYGC